MEVPEYLQPRYFGAMDRPNYLQPRSTGYFTAIENTGDVDVPGNAIKQSLGIDVTEIGATLNPSQHQLPALQSKIREGASRVEFEFMGRQKGGPNQPIPEMHSQEAREAIRNLLELNKVKGSTHATFTVSGLAGFTNGGFSRQQQSQVIQEVQSAIDFAKDATTGGAVVVHTGEWMRPVSKAAENFGDKNKYGVEFESYEEEAKDAMTMLVDKDTGAFYREFANLNKETVIQEPKFLTAKDYQDEFGRPVTGKFFNKKTGQYEEITVQETDWVDQQGNIIDPTDPDQLFRRVPRFNKELVRFESDKVTYQQMVQRAQDFEERWGKKVKPELLMAQTQLDNQILQQRGSSLFHGRGYPQEFAAYKKTLADLDKLNQGDQAVANEYLQPLDAHVQYVNYIQRTAQEQVQELEARMRQEGTTEPQKQRIQAEIQRLAENANQQVMRYINTEVDDPRLKQFFYSGEQNYDEFRNQYLEEQKKQLKRQKDQLELNMKYTHESSGSADARADDLMRKRDALTDIEDYGLKESGRALAKLAEDAMIASKQARAMRTKEELKNWSDLYIAPENVFAQEYGSHPGELRKIIQAGRDAFVKRMTEQRKMDEKKAQELAKKHIKTTFDIGHVNMWRNMMKRNYDKETDTWESEDKFQERFNNWLFKHLDALHKDGMIGHLHITDNFGINDAHLSAGEGNAPIKEFVKWAKEKGYDDFIVEAGSHNVGSYMQDAWAYLGAATLNKGLPFNDVWKQNSGFYPAPNYHVGSYVPSNEWTFWSGVPLE